MTDVEKIAFAVVWWEAKQCPGCFAPLEDVAGVERGHWLAGQKVATPNGPRTTIAGETFEGGNVSLADRRVCPWSADDLTSLVLIGSGTVGYHRGRGDGSPRETAPTRCSSDLPLPGGSQHES